MHPGSPSPTSSRSRRRACPRSRRRRPRGQRHVAAAAAGLPAARTRGLRRDRADLFWRFGGSDQNHFLDHLRDIRLPDVVSDLQFATAHVRELGAERVGVTGFCMGGKFTYLAAVSDVDVQCAAPFYGSAIPELSSELHCPLLAFFGGRDEYIPMEQIEQVRARHPEDVVVYPEAQHGFMRDGSDTYDEEAAADAWNRLLAFFARNLRGSASG